METRCSSGLLSWFCILVLVDFTWEMSAAHPVRSCNDQRLGCDFHRPLNLFHMGKIKMPLFLRASYGLCTVNQHA